MQRFICQFLAAASLMIFLQPGEIAGRPRYGGTLRVEMWETVRSLDPAEWPVSRLEYNAKEKLIALLFEPLVKLDENGCPQAALAVSWQHDSRSRRWQFSLRPDVKFHDGSLMTPEIVATALRASAADWKASALGNDVLIESETPMPDLLFDLAQPSRSIFLRGSDQKISGTGPFQLAKWDPGRRAILAANEQYRAGRPFLDAVSIEMGRSLAEQLVDLELGKADFVEIWPNEMRRIPDGVRTWSSASRMLIALAFERGRPAADDARLREALALSLDRAAMHSWLMQKQGEPAAALLPQKLSGYAFLFSAKTDMKRARQLASTPGRMQSAVLLTFDAFDPLARSMADRIAVNAREAGITLNVSRQPLNADIRLVRYPFHTPLPGSALADLAASFGVTDIGQVPNDASIEAIHAAEQEILGSNRIIPLFHVPEIFGSSPRLKTWITTGVDPFGYWHFDDMWLDAEKP